MKDYLPHGDAELLIWLANFKSKISLYGSEFDMPQNDIAEISTESTELEQAVQDANMKKEEAARAISFKNERRANFLKNIRKEVARIKAHKKYTEAIGQELGIVGAGKSFDATSYKPTLTAEITGGVVRIKFQKKGVDGVNIYHRKRGEGVWRFLARDTRSPYEDRIKLENPTQPEHWEYRAYGVIKDDEIGQPSDVVEVIYGG